MNMRMSVVTGIVLALGASAWAHCGNCGSDKKGSGSDEAHGHAEIGKPAPSFELTGIDGKTYKLEDFKGKIVVLEWTNHQCPVVNRCHDSKVMTETLAKFKGKPVVWLAVDSSHFANDKMSDIKSWASKQDLPYPILIDAEGKVGHAYGAKTTPHMFVIDQKGELAYMGAPTDDPYGDKEDVRNYVEEAVTSLLKDSAVATSTTKPFGCTVKYKSS